MSSPKNLETLAKAVNKSVHQFFETMFSIKVEDGEMVNTIESRPDIINKIEPDIVGVIGLSGAIKGSVSTHHSIHFVEHIGKLMLGVDSISEGEVTDVAGEISNIITGGAKTLASNMGLNFDISCPTVVRGKNSHVEPSKKTSITYQLFTVDGHHLLVTSIAVD